MPQSHWQQVRAAFDAALDVAPAQQTAWLQGRLDLPAAVRAEAARLLAAHRADAAESAPERYRLLRVLGEGGFGTVHLARQLEPVQRLVALKLLKPGMDSGAVLARFSVERESLARMSHPNIAQILDAGTTPAGQPFFAMELVDGVPLVEWCDAQRLPLRARLRLFADVCRGVHHAHLKGVIHRDLKPSNVLVATVDGRAIPKIIDFGIAKAMHADEPDATLTGEGKFIGTPAYMSPEQAGLGGGHVDARSDVYSLGVLLYELLTGRLPFDPATLQGRDLMVVLQHIREVDPPRPSSRLRERSGPTAGAVAAARQVKPAPLQRALRGDLDWVAMRALAKEPERRYQSAAALADDVERHLRCEPVDAGPPGVAYRMRKLVRRHRAAALASVLVLLSLVGGLIAALWQASVARSALEVAVARRLSAQAVALAEEQPTLALLLAVAGAERELGDDARAALYRVMQFATEDWQMDRHERAVSLLAVSDDGGRLMSADASMLVVASSPREHRVLAQFDGHGAPIRAVLITADGKRGCSAGDDGTARVYDLDAGIELAVLRHPGPVTAAGWSADGSVLVTGCADGSLRCFAGAAGDGRALPGGGKAVAAVAVDAAGARAAVLDAEQRVTVLNLGSLTVLRELPPDGTAAASADNPANRPVLQFDRAGGALLVRTTDSRGVLLDLGRGGGDWAFAGPAVEVFDAALSRDGARLVAFEVAPGGTAGASLYDLDSRRRLARNEGDPGSLQCRVAIDGTGSLFATLPLRVPWLDLWDGVTGAHLQRLRGDPHAFHALQFEPDGGHLLGGGQNGGVFRCRCRVLDERRALSQRAKLGASDALAIAGDGRSAVVRTSLPTGSAGAIDLVDTANGVRLVPLLPPGGDTSAMFSPRGDRLLLRRDGVLSVFTVPDGRLLWTAPMPIDLFRVTADLARGVGATAQRALGVADLHTGRLLLERPSADLYNADISADGRLVATADGNRNSATVWDVDAGACLGQIEHQGFLFDCAFEPGSTRLLTVANDTSARITEARTLAMVASVAIPTASVATCAFAADGRCFAINVASDLLVFETQSRNRLVRWQALPGEMARRPTLLSPDGSAVVRWLDDGRTRALPLEPLAAARLLLPRGLTHAEMQRYEVGTPAEREAARAADEAAPSNAWRRVQLAKAALDDGRLADALAELDRAQKTRQRMPLRFHLVTAMAFACRAAGLPPGGERQTAVGTAVAALRRCVDGGMGDPHLFGGMPQLAPLRSEPAFAEFVQSIR